MANQSWRPYAVLVLGLVAVSSASVFIRLAQQEGATSLVISAWRVGLAALVLTPLVLTRHRAELSILTRAQIGLALLSGILLAFHFASWVTSLEYTSVITSTVLVTTNPLWVALAAPFVLREKISKNTLIGVGLAITGAIIISAAGGAGTAPKQNAPLLGASLALIGSFAVAGYFLIGRQLRGKLSVITYIWLTYSTSAIALCIMVLFKHESFVGLTSNAYLWMTFLALVPQLIGHSSYNYALGFLSAAFVSLTVVGEPIGSTILAAIVLNERPFALQLVGGLLIFAALVIASREEARSARRLMLEAERQAAVSIP